LQPKKSRFEVAFQFHCPTKETDMAVKPKAPAKKSPAAKAPAKKAPAKKAPAKAAAAKKATASDVMTVKHLAAELSEAHAMPKKQAEAVVTDFIDRMGGYLKKGKKLRISGLGILQVRKRPARNGRNPATGESIKIKASKKVAFRPSKDLKDRVL
jgi:DNA-binding protein HU-beta